MDDLNNTLEKLQTLMVSDVDNNDVNDSDAECEAKDDIEVDGVTTTLTENGDLAYTNVNSPLVDILFKSEYYRKHPDEVSIGTSEKERLFSMMMRDPRYGLGQKVLGRRLERERAIVLDDDARSSLRSRSKGIGPQTGTRKSDCSR